MHRIKRILGGALLGMAAVCMLLVSGLAVPSSAGPPQTPNADPVPAHHEAAPTGPLPETLSPTLFSAPVAQQGYNIAARIKKVLYQQPCYCHCDRSQGHGSLLDCFTGRHAAECGVCLAEDFYAYEQTQKGKTPAEIRGGIERGEWRKVDTKKYDALLPAPSAK